MRGVKLRVAVVLSGLGLAVWALRPTRHEAAAPLRLATFNIERFGSDEKETDLERLVVLVDELDPDVLAVQEIEHPAKFARVVERLGRGPRRYPCARSPSARRTESP